MWNRRDFLKSVGVGIVTPLVMQSAATAQDAPAKLVLVLGCCGTGKTAFARMLASRKNCILIDEGSLSMRNLPQELVPPWADEQWHSGKRSKTAYLLMLRRKYVAERSTTVIVTVQAQRSSRVMLPCSFSMFFPCDLVYSTKRVAPGIIQTIVVKDRYSPQGKRTQYRVGRGLSLTEV